MRWRLAALGATLAVVAGGGAVYVVGNGDDNGRRVRSVSTPTPPPTRSPALTSLAPEAPTPTRAGVAQQLRRPASSPALGGALAALVVDATTGEPLFVRRPGARLSPASTTKLLTAI